MKTIEQLGLKVPEILLPKEIDTATWAVIACDQYTQDPEYWKHTEESTNNQPSTLNLILPEVYLGSNDKQERIKKIRQTMNEYLSSGVFAEPKNAFIYVERTTAFGRTRKGLVAQIDLETYEWKPFSKANIRATEATIIDRIPPRKEIRKNAPLELPHIMLLVNDKEKVLVEACGQIAKKDNKAPVYSGKLMMNGGEISGWALESKEEINAVESALNRIAEKNTSADGSTFLFAVGDGNHSLATAKAVWDEYKAELIEKGASKEEIENCNVRYALVEIVNIYDEGLTFEPIHRVIFNIETSALIECLKTKLGGSTAELNSFEELDKAVKASTADFGFVYLEGEKQKFTLLKTEIKELAVSRLQPEIDEFLKTAPQAHICDDTSCRMVSPEIDYIHGDAEVLRLGSQANSTGILLPPISKDSFFETINGRGPLPRKSFSMGEADEKRFYLECRKLF